MLAYTSPLSYKNKSTIMIAFFVFMLFGIVQGLPGGAPENSCDEMIPRHPGTTPQEGTSSNFSTIPDKVEIEETGKIRLTISSSNKDIAFKGYLVVATEVGTNAIIGNFRNPSDGQILDCVLSNNEIHPMTGATHRNNAAKSSVTVDWIPNGFVGDVVFRTTYVLDEDTYWVKEDSAVVKVLPALETTFESSLNSSLEANPPTASTMLTTDGAGTLISRWAMTVLMLVSLAILKRLI